MAKVTIIPSTINPLTQAPITSKQKRRVCAYARVSTDSDEQYTSYEAQVTYYKKYIQEHPEWEYVDVYADEGITGTNRKKRDSFNKMIKEALEGKIDLIITKSISRFARNTLDTISITRELKAKGVEVFFEKENLWTFDSKSELVLTIMASIAQEESRSISANVTIGKRWGFQEGKVSFAYKNFLGYKKGADGKIEIDEAQAVIVKMIYRMFLIEGKTCTSIATYLAENGVLTPSGKSTRWQKNTVLSILKNEKYKGDALLQKTFTDNYLEHSMKKNEGELPQYYVENSHPAIIDKYTWEQVQTELQRRMEIGNKYSSTSIFATKLVCEDCGGFFGKKIWHSTSKYARAIYQCNSKFKKGKDKCGTPHFTEDEIKELFIKAYNLVMKNKDQMLEDTIDVVKILTDTSALDERIATLQNEIEVVSELVKKMVKENKSAVQSQEDYMARYTELSIRYEKAKNDLDKVLSEKSYKLGQATKLEAFVEELRGRVDWLEIWDDEIWMIMVERAIVHKDKSITFEFYNGQKIRAYLNEAVLN